MKRLTVRLFIFVATLAALFNVAAAQTTIINTPSTDVVAPKQTYLEFDFLTHPTRFRDGGFRNYAARVVTGVAKGVEVGANVSFTDAFEPNQPVEVQPNAKWKFYNNEEAGVAASAGVVSYIPVRNREGTDTFALTYANISKKVEGRYGPRVTVGAYTTVGQERDSGTRRGATVAYEQPLHRKFTLVGDWFSGKNRFGYVAPGFIYTPTSKTLIGGSYIIGNEGRGNNALYVFFGYTF